MKIVNKLLTAPPQARVSHASNICHPDVVIPLQCIIIPVTSIAKHYQLCFSFNIDCASLIIVSCTYYCLTLFTYTREHRAHKEQGAQTVIRTASII